MKRYISLLLALLMISMPLAACSGSEDSADDDVLTSEEAKEDETPDTASGTDNTPEIIYQPESSGIFFEEEVEDAELKFVKSDVSEYAGSWQATSDQAVYYYGNFDIVINPDGTWTGNITEEDFEGTWDDLGDHIHLNNTSLFNLDLAFEESGKLIMTETGSDLVLHTVLTKK